MFTSQACSSGPLLRFVDARLPLALVMLALCGAGFGCNDEPTQRRVANRHDVVLVVVDTLRPDRLGCYGSDAAATPAIDALANAGVRAAECWAQSSWTGPSMVSMFTSRRIAADSVGMPDEPTLTERLHDFGYVTVAAQWNTVLKPGGGHDRDFDAYLMEPGDRAIAQAIEAAGKKPLFLYLHFPALDDAETIGRSKVVPADAWLARVLGMLKQSGRLERTLVVVAAGHGETLFEHAATASPLDVKDANRLARAPDPAPAPADSIVGEEEIPQSPEESLRVPLVFSGAGVPKGFVLQSPVENLDVMPTVLELLGIEPNGTTDGVSLVPTVKALVREDSTQEQSRAH